ncbi:hypothetical protein OAA09_01255 [bacterium]|nr:hypothetical protein [bacterium]
MGKKTKKNKMMKWECRELEDGRWGVFLCEEFWRFPDKPVIYGATINKEACLSAVARMNNPKYYIDPDDPEYYGEPDAG